MPLYKVFTSAAYGEDVRELERGINDWMSREVPRILFMKQSAHGQHVVISFVFDSGGSRGAAVATESAEVPEVFERTLGDADLDPGEQPDVLLPEAELPY